MVLKSIAKAFLMECKGKLKNLPQLFYCIYVLFKTLVEHCSIDVCQLKLQKREKEIATGFWKQHAGLACGFFASFY